MPVIPCLPQNDLEKEKRQWLIDEMKDMYDYDLATIAPIPIVKRVPARDYFAPKYKGTSDSFQMEGGRALAAGAVAAGAGNLHSLDAYDKLLAGYKRSNVLRGHLMDAYFAEQRVAGVNPMKLERLREIPRGFPFTNSHLALAFRKSQNRTLDEECKAGRLFVTDYSDFDDVPCGMREGGAKFLPAPLALYVWREGSFGGRGDLVPLGISVRPGTNAERIVKTPRSDPEHWTLAKLAVQIADGNHHELSSHLCRTHFVMEPFAISTPRHLSWRHPVFMLLRPHLRFMLAQNSYGRDVLLSPGRVVDRLLGATLDGSFGLIVDAWESWRFDKAGLPSDLETRGLRKDEALPHFPYRDDGLLVWAAIEKFVGAYLRVYYKNDPADVLADFELQAWARELASPDMGRVKGFPSTLGSIQQLTHVLTTVIYTCGPLHAAVNFPQFDYMAHVPNMPLAAYAELPMEGSTPEQIWERIMPPRERAIEQIQILFSLTAFRHDRLGDYSQHEFEDPAVASALHQFRVDLYEAERTIQHRNEKRLLPYPYLQPSLIPNSTAI